MHEYVRNNKYVAIAKAFWLSIDEFLDAILPNIGHLLTSRLNGNGQIFNFT